MKKTRRGPRKPKRSRVEYKVHGLDVWGNKRDGFSVNDVYPSQGTVEIPEDATEREIVMSLKRGGFLKRNIRQSSVEITGEPGYDLYIGDARLAKPEYELRRVKS